MIDERLHIEELLKRFMEGETTLDEERFLGDWLRTHEADDSLKPYRRMFAAFDAGLPLPANEAGDKLKRPRLVQWRWAAAAVIAGLLALGGIQLAKRLAMPTEQSPIVAKETSKSAVDTIVENDNMKPTLADKRHEVDMPAAHVVTANTKAVKKKPGTVVPFDKQDSIEVARTAGDLELAESEFLAEQQDLGQQLQEVQQQRLERRSGWHYTSFPCE